VKDYFADNKQLFDDTSNFKKEEHSDEVKKDD